MKLLKMTLTNFQGIKSLTLDFEGKSASIYGDNATGKTTVFNAFTWLLFDAPSNSAKNFSPKTKGADGDLHNLEHGAEAVFQMGNGRIVTLKKVLSEVYTKKRGSAEAVFAGHTVTYFVDGVPEKQKEYEFIVTTLFDEREVMKMLTMPDFFSESLSWEQRRRILLEICGDVSDEDIIKNTPELKELTKYLAAPGTENQSYSVEEYRKIASAKQREINKRLEEIPGRIDEAQRAIPDVSKLDEGEINARIAELNAQREALAEKKARILAIGGTAEIRRQIAELDTKTALAETEHAKRQLQANSGVTLKLSEARTEEARLESDIRKLDASISSTKSSIESMAEEREKLRGEYSRIYAETWDEGKAVCPTCGRVLPADKVEKMRSDFNLNRSSRLQEIKARGERRCSQSAIDGLKSELAEQEAKRENIIGQLETTKSRIEELEKSIIKPTPFSATEEYVKLASMREELEAKLNDEDKACDEALDAVKGEIAAVEAEIDKQREGLALFGLVKAQEKRIRELEDEEENLGGEYEELEKGLYLCGLFVKTKVGTLTDKINGRFKSVRFRLFREQINGGISEDCEVMVPSEGGSMVPYAFANNAARINAGLEIISALSESRGMSMPVFVDNAESVTHLTQTDTQTIRLVVSEADKVLRVEVES